jgi:hypothetical protein
MSNYKQEKQIQQSITDSINKILSEAVVNGFVAPSKQLVQSPFQNAFDKAQSMFGASDKKAAPGIAVPLKNTDAFSSQSSLPNTEENNPAEETYKSLLLPTKNTTTSVPTKKPSPVIDTVNGIMKDITTPAPMAAKKPSPVIDTVNGIMKDITTPTEETYKSLLLPTKNTTTPTEKKKPSPVIDTVNGIMKDITTPAPMAAKKPSPVIDTINGIMKDITAPMGTPNTSGTAIRSPFVAKPQVNTPATNPGFMLSPQGAPASRPSQTGDFKVTPADPSTPATNPGFMALSQNVPNSSKYELGVSTNAELDKQTGTNGRNIGDMRKENEQMAQARRDRGEPGLVGSPEDIAWRKAKDQKRLDDAGINKTVDQVVSEPKSMSASDIVGGAAAAGEAYRNKGMTRVDFNAKRDAAEEAAYPGSTKGRPARNGGSNVGLSSDTFGISRGSGPGKPVIGEPKRDETSEEYQARVKDAVTNFKTARDANRQVNSRPVYSQDGNVTDSYTGENIGTQDTTGSNVTSNNSRSRNNQGGRGRLKENFNVTLPSTRNNYYNKNINKLGSLGIPVNEGVTDVVKDVAKGVADIAITPWGKGAALGLGDMGQLGFDAENVKAYGDHYANIQNYIASKIPYVGPLSKAIATPEYLTQMGFDMRSRYKTKSSVPAAGTTTTPTATTTPTPTTTPTATTPKTSTTPKPPKTSTTTKPPKTSTPTPSGTPTGRKPGSASTWASNRSQIHNVKPGIALT